MKYKILGDELVYKGVVFNLRKKKIELPNGDHSSRDIIEPKTAVAIVAITDEGKVLLVSQYRTAVKKNLWEIPAGLVEDGEDPKKAAKRELEEETGYRANQIEEVAKIHTNPGILSGSILLYRASNLVKTKQNLDEDEYIEIGEFYMEEAKKRANMDAKSIIGLIKVQDILNKKEKKDENSN
ncbi:MAG: NUDIX hydrolase [Fusobacteriota bacterium]